MPAPGGSEVATERGAFLDRDGVLARAVVRQGCPHPAGSTEQLEVLPGVVDACGALRAAGLRLVCVTNQPDIARGFIAASIVNEQNALLESVLGLDAVLVCPHDDVDDCACRKPRPGLLLDGAARFGIDLQASVMVGDRWRDVDAGQNAGCRTVFIEHHYAERRPVRPDLTVGSLAEATPWILRVVGLHEPRIQEQS